ncbi:Fc.00g025170.m01.CDS01 [Cosmosporella sp. VM-42]
MVALPDVIASNERIAPAFPNGLVAVFIGGTSGVGEYTLKAFAKHSSNPRVYVVGRSQEAADRIIQECKQLNRGGTFEFLKLDVSLVKNVDEVCVHIKKKETAINILFQSQGSMAFEKVTPEGLLQGFGLVVHSRIRFILNLLPLLQRADSLRRVVSVLAATTEGAIDTNNITGQGFSIIKQRNQMASVQSLLLEEIARRVPDVSFIHCLPGLVKGNITREAEGFKTHIFIAIGKLLEPFLQTPPVECGERQVFLATSAMYPPAQGDATIAGLILDQKLEIARGSDGKMGSGMYTVGPQGDSSPPHVEKLLAECRANGTAEQVWDFIMADFKRITGSEVAPETILTEEVVMGSC